MQYKNLDNHTKAVVIEIMDVFNEIPSQYDDINLVPEKVEKDAHIRVVKREMKKAKNEGYKKWKFLKDGNLCKLTLEQTNALIDALEKAPLYVVPHIF